MIHPLSALGRLFAKLVLVVLAASAWLFVACGDVYVKPLSERKAAPDGGDAGVVPDGGDAGVVPGGGDAGGCQAFHAKCPPDGCVNLLNNDAHCGMCNFACEATEVCANQDCVLRD